MKFPTLTGVLGAYKKTFFKFPLAILVGWFATFLSVSLVEGVDYVDEDLFEAFLLTTVFTFTTLVGVSFFAKSLKLSEVWKWFLRILAVMSGVAVYFVYAQIVVDDFLLIETVRFFILNLLAVHFVFVAPYLFKRTDNKNYGHYVMSVVAAVLETALYFAIFYLGVVALLASVDYLFDVRIEELYVHVFSLLAGVFALPYLLNALPDQLEKFSLKKLDNSSLKLLKYFLAPLVIAYLVVLYLYGFSIVLPWSWPDGGVAGWIIAFCSVGVIAYFMAVFLAPKNSYLTQFKKWFYPALLPLLFMLFWAVWLRIDEFGFTEIRYLGILFGLWFLVSAIYFILRGKKSQLKFLSLSLFIFSIVATWGPINMFDVSINDQAERLKVAVEANDINAIRDISRYLRDREQRDLAAEIAGDEVFDGGIYKPKNQYYGEGILCNYNTGCNFEISGFDYFSQFRVDSYQGSEGVDFENNLYFVLRKDDNLVVERNGEILLSIAIESLLEEDFNTMPIFDFNNKKGRILVNSYGFSKNEESGEISNFRTFGYLLLKSGGE
jgi:hypothetical protein